MINIIPFLIIVTVAVFVVKLLSRFSGRKVKNNEDELEEEVLPYYKKEYIMTEAEHNFFKVLEQVVKDRYHIVPQVVLSNLVDVVSAYRWNKSYRSKIDKKTIDFVLFTKDSYTPYLAIELDDRSHQNDDRVVRDEFVQHVMDKVGIRLARVENAYTYNPETLAGILNL